MAERAFLVDTIKCTGCRACQVACKQWNELPAEETEFFAGTEYTNPGALSAITWNHVIFSEPDRSSEEKPIWQITHKKCYHCNRANCQTVCPEKAISKYGGFTIINQDKCIGCNSCVEACVYKVPQLAKQAYMSYQNIQKNKAHKCHACIKSNRDIPACVSACPTGSLSYDIRLKILIGLEKRLRTVKKTFPNASIYGKEQFGGLHVLTILKDSPEKSGLPLNPKEINEARAEEVNDLYALFSIFTFGIEPLKRSAHRLAKALVGRKQDT